MDTNRSDITAEWTVRAHLTITRPTENLLQRVTAAATKRDNCDGGASESRNLDTIDNPFRVVYKWCSDDAKEQSADPAFNNDGYSTFNRGNFLVSEAGCTQNENFQSTEIPPSDSGLSATTNQSIFSPRFRSTCNIILSASTDLLPRTNELCDNISTRCHTTFPEQEVFCCGVSVYGLTFKAFFIPYRLAFDIIRL